MVINKVDLSRAAKRVTIPISDRKRKTVKLFKQPLGASKYAFGRQCNGNQGSYDPIILCLSSSLVISNNIDAINRESARLALISLNHGYLYLDDTDSSSGRSRNDLINCNWKPTYTQKADNPLYPFSFSVNCLKCKVEHLVEIWEYDPDSAISKWKRLIVSEHECVYNTVKLIPLPKAKGTRKHIASSRYAQSFMIECQYCKVHLPYHLSPFHVIWIWSSNSSSAMKTAITMYNAMAKPVKSACIYAIKPELLAKRIHDYDEVFVEYID